MKLSLEEKFRLLTAKDAWTTQDFGGKIKSVRMTDGPHGVRRCDDKETIKSTAYPALSLVACSWNPQAAYLMASSIASDCIEQGVDILLAPGVNMKRSPLCGRNFEYFSEDPYLSGSMACSYIEGLQDCGVGATLKHFACNNGENHRFYQNSELDERTLYESYLTAFEISLQAKPWMVMCAYNKVNGVFASENEKLLKEILRDKFGYDGVIVSDWEAVKNRAKALKATLDLEMPYNAYSYDELKTAYENGFIADQEIDACVNRLLALAEKTCRVQKKVLYARDQRHKNALNIARESVVLLKNENRILPMKKYASVDLFRSCDLEVTQGGGSAKVESNYPEVTLASALEKQGYAVNANLSHENVIGETSGDYLIYTVGSNQYEMEGVDRNNIDVRNMDAQKILYFCERGEKVIVVIYAGSVVDISLFADKAAAIVYAGFGGEAGNEAVADILSGSVCPSGKLAETFPRNLSETPVDGKTENPAYAFYGERFFFGYRFYDKMNIPPLFAFGSGLSYAHFEYSDLAVEKIGDTEFFVSYSITNISEVCGKEISQVYVRDISASCERPVKELRAFSKDEFKAGETKRVTLQLGRRAFAFYNPSLGEYYVENGKFEILVGASSVDIRLKHSVVISLPAEKQCSIDHKGKARGQHNETR